MGDIDEVLAILIKIIKIIKYLFHIINSNDNIRLEEFFVVQVRQKTNPKGKSIHFNTFNS